MQRADVIVIGGGIVGLATAWQIQRRRPGTKLLVLEKEAVVGAHQSSHNSGVLHTGIYYKPGSLKARNCVAGRRAMVEFCETYDIRHEICGKLIVATDESELPHLLELQRRGQANGVSCELIDSDEIREIEPDVAGIKALRVPETGIIDYSTVVTKLASLIKDGGGDVSTNSFVYQIHESSDFVTVTTGAGTCEARHVVNCAGLHSDKVTRLAGTLPPARIIPFRGEYYRFKAASPRLCRNMVYPVPNPEFPFLGAHFTRTIDGAIEVGPNAVLALAREGYKKTNIKLSEALGTLSYPGFLRMAARHWRTGAQEAWRSLSKKGFVRSLQRMIPAVRASHLEAAPAGVRAQAVRPDGSLIDDFLIKESQRIVHVCNAPSPAATACLAIGESLAKTVDS